MRSKIVFDLEESDWHDHSTESLWANPLSDGLFQLDNIPFYIYGVSFGDIVYANPESGNYRFRELERSGGHSTYRIFIFESSDTLPVEKELAKIVSLGCSLERADEYLIAIDVPPNIDIFEAYRLIENGEKKGLWDFDEGKCSHDIHNRDQDRLRH